MRTQQYSLFRFPAKKYRTRCVYYDELIVSRRRTLIIDSLRPNTA